MQYATVFPKNRKPPMQDHLLTCIETARRIFEENLSEFKIGVICKEVDDNVPKYYQTKLRELGLSASWEHILEEETETKYTYDFLGNINGAYQVVNKKFAGYKITVKR